MFLDYSHEECPYCYLDYDNCSCFDYCECSECTGQDEYDEKFYEDMEDN